jgi:hypothetical protein
MIPSPFIPTSSIGLETESKKAWHIGESALGYVIRSAGKVAECVPREQVDCILRSYDVFLDFVQHLADIYWGSKPLT